jgi:hypothetical protein
VLLEELGLRLGTLLLLSLLTLLLLLNQLLTLRDASLTLSSTVDDLVLANADAKLQPLEDPSYVDTALLFDFLLRTESLDVLFEEVDGGVGANLAGLEAIGCVVDEALDEFLPDKPLCDLPEEFVCALLANLLSRIAEEVED